MGASRKKAVCLYLTPETKIEAARQKRIFSIIERHFALILLERDAAKSLPQADIVLTVGGDGTFLKAARLMKRPIPLLGINPHPETKEGFYAKATLGDLEGRLRLFLSGRHKMVPLPKLQASIDGRRLPFHALNECFFGNEKSYLSAKYVLSVHGKKEFQKSSGLIVATPSGSHAWYASAGGKPIAFDAGRFVYTAREPYCGKVVRCTLHQGTLSARQKLRITSLLDTNILAIDSALCYPVRKNAIVEIKAAKDETLWVTF